MSRVGHILHLNMSLSIKSIIIHPPSPKKPPEVLFDSFSLRLDNVKAVRNTDTNTSTDCIAKDVAVIIPQTERRPSFTFKGQCQA